MPYVDAFVAAVPTSNRAAYLDHARRTGALFREVGAVSVMEMWADDVPDGQLTSFPMAVQRQADEAVVLSWVVWPDKPTREAGWAKMMADPDMQASSLPFDGRRMIYGGFEVIHQT